MNIEDGIPGVKALVDECIEVLGETQLDKSRLQLARHAVDFWGVVGVTNGVEGLSRS